MKAFTRDPNCLGYIVLYGTSSEAVQRVDDVNRELRKNSLAYRLRRPSATRAVSRAAKETAMLSEHKFFRNLVNDSDRKSAAIIYERVNKPKNRIRLRQQTTGTYDKLTRLFHAHGPDSAEFERLFDLYSQYVTGDDIRAMARRIVERAYCISLRGGTSVKDAGGVYFVPRRRIDEIESLKRVLENLGIGYVKAFSVTAGKSERADLFRAAVAYFQKEVQSIQDSAEKVTTRVSALRKHRKQLEDTKTKMAAYAILTNRTRNRRVREFYSDVQRCMAKIDKKIRRLEKKKIKRK